MARSGRNNSFFFDTQSNAAGFGLSLAFHAFLIVGGLLWVPQARQLATPITTPPIELLTIDELTRLLEDPDAQPPEDVIEEAPETLIPETLIEDDPLKEPTPPPPEPPEIEETIENEAPPPEDEVAEEEPIDTTSEEVAVLEAAPADAPPPDAEIVALPDAPVASKPLLDTEPPIDPEAIVTIDADPKAAFQPLARPTRPTEQRFLDIAQVHALLNKIPDAEQGAPTPEIFARDGTRAPIPQDDAAASVLSARLTISEVDYFRSQISRCWSIEAGVPEAENLVVRVQMRLSLDGYIAAGPQIVNRAGLINQYFRAAAERVLRAIRQCQPYIMPADKYDSWQKIDLNFDPHDMLTG